MKQTLSFNRKEVAILIAQGIAIKHGIVIDKVEFVIECTPVSDQPTGVWNLTEVKAWIEDKS